MADIEIVYIDREYCDEGQNKYFCRGCSTKYAEENAKEGGCPFFEHPYRPPRSRRDES